MEILVPMIVAVALWWGATVAMLYRTGLPEASFPRTLLFATVLAVAGLGVIVATAGVATPLGAYAAFGGALLVWAWHEISYFLGYVTGPRPESCPREAPVWQRFLLGIQASLYHELAVIATGLLLVALTWGAPNQVALWTYCILWAMRWSAKLNIFLGVRNLHLDFLPKRLQYLGSYVTHRHMNPLFPVSMIVSAVFVGVCIQAASTSASLFVVTGAVLCATLLVLAMIEHLFLMCEVPDRALWRLGLGDRETPAVARNQDL